MRRIIVFPIPAASKIQGSNEILSGSSQDLTELAFSSLRNIPAGEEPLLSAGLAQLDGGLTSRTVSCPAGALLNPDTGRKKPDLQLQNLPLFFPVIYLS